MDDNLRIYISIVRWIQPVDLLTHRRSPSICRKIHGRDPRAFAASVVTLVPRCSASSPRLQLHPPAEQCVSFALNRSVRISVRRISFPCCLSPNLNDMIVNLDQLLRDNYQVMLANHEGNQGDSMTSSTRLQENLIVCFQIVLSGRQLPPRGGLMSSTFQPGRASYRESSNPRGHLHLRRWRPMCQALRWLPLYLNYSVRTGSKGGGLITSSSSAMGVPGSILGSASPATGV